MRGFSVICGALLVVLGLWAVDMEEAEKETTVASRPLSYELSRDEKPRLKREGMDNDLVGRSVFGDVVPHKRPRLSDISILGHTFVGPADPIDNSGDEGGIGGVAPHVDHPETGTASVPVPEVAPEGSEQDIPEDEGGPERVGPEEILGPEPPMFADVPLVEESPPVQFSYRPSEGIVSAQPEGPSAVLFSATWCGPCQTMKAALEKHLEASGREWVMGEDPGSLLRIVDCSQNSSDVMAGFGATNASLPNMIIVRDGKWVPAPRPIGSRTPEQVLAWMEDNGVSLTPPVRANPAVAELPQGAGFSSVIAVLAHHLECCAGAEIAVGGLFDVDLDVPDTVPGMIRRVLVERKWSNEGLGIRVELPEDATIAVSPKGLRFSKPVKIRWQKSIVAVDARLSRVGVSTDGRELTFILEGSGVMPVPDITVILK